MYFQTGSQEMRGEKRYHSHRFVRICFATVIALWLVGSGFAQTERGSIRGTIQDPSGAVMTGVKVTAVNVATGVTWETKTTVDGLYSVQNLPAGTYKVTAELAGFKGLVENNVVVAVAAIVGLDLKMEVGKVTESITVTAASATLQTEDSERAMTLDNRSYMDLPLTAGGLRSPENFFLLSPGVAGDTFNTRVNGSVNLSRDIQLDGMSLNDRVWGNPSPSRLRRCAR